MAKQKKKSSSLAQTSSGYESVLGSISELLESARRTSARSVNTIMTHTYWEIGRQIVEFEQKGELRAEYGKELFTRLSGDLTTRFGRGFSQRNLRLMRAFYLRWPIWQTPSAKLGGGEKRQTVSGKSEMANSESSRETSQLPSPIFHSGKSEALSRISSRVGVFPLPWSHYVRLLSVKKQTARDFYEAEAIRGGWSIRQLERQINSQFYERTALSRNKAAMLSKGQKPKREDFVTPEQEVKDPYVLEFLDLKDEYSESDLEEALIRRLESFLLELGGDFAFVGRQRRLRIGDEWYRVDLLFFHRGLRCLVVIDLKIGPLTHADAGQMHLYLNYAREHWTHPDENPPVGLILCAAKNQVLAKYALEGLPNKVVAAEYRTTLPDEQRIAAELAQTRRLLQTRRAAARKK